MGSKTILFLGLFLAVFLMISSEVAARELAETSNSVNEVENGIGGDHYYYGGKGGYKHKGCHYKCHYKCCSYEEYVAMVKANEAQP